MRKALISFLAGLLLLMSTGIHGFAWEIGLLSVGSIRAESLHGFLDGLESRGLIQGEDYSLRTYDAGGDRDQLLPLAAMLAESSPDVAVAAGGIEADALASVLGRDDTPIVFLAVASSVERGLVDSMRSPGSNITGVDTSDSMLTGKRLEWLRMLLPSADRVLVIHVPGNVPSRQSIDVARRVAPTLGLELVVLEAEDDEEIRQAAESVTAQLADAVLLLPVAPVWNIVEGILYPTALKEGLPIFGVNHADLERGAVACYAVARYDAAFQASRLVIQLLRGADPAEIPVERPDRLEFVLNISAIDALHLDVPKLIWVLADAVTEAQN